MRACRLLLLACLCQGCASCDEPSADPARSATVDPPAPVERADVEPASAGAESASRTERARSLAERLDRLAVQSPEARERLRTRVAHLREGRRLGHARDHAAALAQFEAALEAEPHDVTVGCEAGYQALQLGHYARAAQHLTAAIARAAPPRTRAMCLYNLGRVREEQSQLYEAEQLYRTSFNLRPHRTVRARLSAVSARLDEDERQADEGGESDPLGTNTDAIAGRVFESLAALDGAAGCGSAGWGMGSGELSAVPHPSPALRELNTLDCDDDDAREVRTFLVARTDAGWTYVDTIGQSDMGDTYGRLEAGEQLEELRFDGDRVLVHVVGGFDEPDGEADAYWACESEHPDDADAMDECFAEGGWADAQPETWGEWHSYVIANGRLGVDPNPPDFDALSDRDDEDE